jgi:hypothetical protein
MKHLIRSMALALVLPFAVDAQVLTFEGILTGGASEGLIGNYYNGGAGPNYGVEFSSNALALCLDSPLVNCSNTSRGGLGDPASQFTGLFFLEGSSTFMNRVAGFNSGFSFFYTAINNPGAFSVWSGLNGTGSLLATLALPVTTSGPCPSYAGPFCPFVAAGVAFAGTAQSVTFAGVGNQIVFDDVTFGSAVPGTTITPEPGTLGLLATGLVGLFGIARRRRNAA